MVHVGGVRLPHATLIAAGLAIVAVCAYLWLSRGFQFYFDEWDFVLHQPATALDYFAPHNEHWSTVPILIYQALLNIMGMRSHVPFMATLLLMHAASALLLFRIVRRRSGDLPAIAATVLLLAFGWGADDFLWAFQIGFQGSIMFGLLAIDLLDSDSPGRLRSIAAAGSLLVAVASSGAGVAFVAAVGVDLAFHRVRRPRLFTVAPAIAGYLVWFLFLGRPHVHAAQNLLAPTTLALLAQYVAFGIGAATAAVAGIGTYFGGPVVFAALVPLSVTAAYASWRRIDSRVLGALAGILVEFGAAGLVRAQTAGYAEAGGRRYLYVAAIFVLLIGTAAIGRLPRHRYVVPALAFAGSIALAGNMVALWSPVTFWNSASRTQTLELETLNVLRGSPGLALDESPDGVLMPQLTVGTFYSAEDRFGSPVPPADLSSLKRIDPELVHSVIHKVLMPE